LPACWISLAAAHIAANLYLMSFRIDVADNFMARKHVTQPIRLEDAVTVQNEYGWIEEINATYVVIRLWDLRRLIVPLNYFIQQPFYNWSRQRTPPLGSVVLYLDYATPVDIVRAKAIELVDKTKRDNAKVTDVQVTNTSPQAIEVRVLVNSDSTSTTAMCAPICGSR
jgi:small-conductance mechanosensitive channel